MSELIEPDLSYEIVGLCMKIHSELGSSCKEKYYQRALAIAFADKGIGFKREIKVDMSFEGKSIGYYYLDFLVNGSIVVELKAKPCLTRNDIKQALDYLDKSNLRLGIIINFGKNSLEQKRIVNKNYKI